MKTFHFASHCLCLLMTYACIQRTSDSGSVIIDSLELTTDTGTSPETVAAGQPVTFSHDDVIVSYPNGQKLRLTVLEYYDSLPDRPIKNFEVRNTSTNEIIFKSSSKLLSLGDEVDPINGKFDSLLVIPTYSISAQDPLSVDLNFIVKGNFRIGYLGDVTYPFYENPPWNRLSFLRYTFYPPNSKSSVQSSLLFTPQACNTTERELLAQFNKMKKEGNLDTERGGELMKVSFTCFLNNLNPHYKMMNREYKDAFGDSVSPYYYYSYIVYLDEFIINLIPR